MTIKFMIARIKTVNPSHASRYYTSGRDYEVCSSQWSGKLARTLEVEAQPVSQVALEQLAKGRNPCGEILVDKTRLYRRQENAIAVGQKPQKERAGEDLVLNPPKSLSLEILVFGNRELELAHQLANTRTLQIVEERFARTRISASGQQISVATKSLIAAQFEHGTNRRLEPHRHTHNLILNLQQHPHTQRWQTLDNSALRPAEKWIGQIYRNELAYLVQAMGYPIQVTHQDGRWELSGFSPNQLRAFSQRTVEIETAVGIAATSQQKQFANIITRPAKSGFISDSDIEREWQRQAAEIKLQPTQPNSEIADQNVRAQQQAMTQFLMWLNQTFDRRDHDRSIRSPCRDEIEQFSLRIPGQFSFQELQQVIDRYCPPFHSGAFSNDVQRLPSSRSAISEPQPSATGSISSEREYGRSTTESYNIPESLTPECNAFGTAGEPEHPTPSNLTTPSSSADEHILFFYDFSSSDTPSGDISDCPIAFEPAIPEQSISGCGTSSAPAEYGNSSAGREIGAIPAAPDTADATDGRATDQHRCSEEAPRTNSDQQRSRDDSGVIEARSRNFDQQRSAETRSDYSRADRHQEESEPFTDSEAHRLEAARLEMER